MSWNVTGTTSWPPPGVEYAVDDRIGSWVTRQRGDKRVGLPHLVESVVDDEPVTRCGRRLRTLPDTHFAYVSVPAIRVCAVCS